MSSAVYATKTLDHLGLVAGLCQDLDLASLIDAKIPNQSQQRHISYGQLVVGMVLNGLGFAGRTLHLYPGYCQRQLKIDTFLG